MGGRSPGRCTTKASTAASSRPASPTAGLTAYPGGDRDRWEHALFAGAYQRPNVRAGERPKYGGLYLMHHLNGACPRFGSWHLRLRPEVTRRATLVFGDSNAGPRTSGSSTPSRPSWRRCSRPWPTAPAHWDARAWTRARSRTASCAATTGTNGGLRAGDDAHARRLHRGPGARRAPTRDGCPGGRRRPGVPRDARGRSAGRRRSPARRARRMARRSSTPRTSAGPPPAPWLDPSAGATGASRRRCSCTSRTCG